jgi:hypothetical protein
MNWIWNGRESHFKTALHTLCNLYGDWSWRIRNGQKGAKVAPPHFVE